jgi:pseudouridine-5'-phosphate glycosidase
MQRAAAALCAPGGLLLCVPPPAEVALPYAQVAAAVERALHQAAAAAIRGPAVTPFLLAAVARETHGESIATNTALLRQNAQIAARIAAQLI